MNTDNPTVETGFDHGQVDRAVESRDLITLHFENFRGSSTYSDYFSILRNVRGVL